MRCFSLAALSLFALSAAACGPASAPADEAELATSARDDIVGGSATSEFPAAGAITRYGSPHCTGTLVGPRTVLTAAHCLTGVTAASLKFVIGASIWSAQAAVSVQSITAHPDYDDVKLVNDVGFLTLGADAPVAPMKILPTMDSSWVGRQLTFVGYGLVSGKGGGSGTKRGVTMPIHSVGATQFVYQTAGKNTCNGDSGGPAFAKVGDEWFVAGVTSYGDVGCTQYGVDVRADAYASFVLGQPSGGEPPPPPPADPCQGETYEGRCDGSTVIWCENAQVKQISCQSCGFDVAKGYYNCQ